MKENEVQKTDKAVVKVKKSPFDFSEDISEVNGVGSIYLGRYPKLLTMNNTSAVFEVHDSLSDKFEVIKTAKEFKVSLLYYHAVVKLTRGGFAGKNQDNWTDEDKQIIAASYDSPFGGMGSKGNFKHEYESFLTDPAKKEFLNQKVYCFLMIHKEFGQEIIPATFGPSTWKSIQKLKSRMTSLGYLIPILLLNMTLEPDKQVGTNKTYNRVVFNELAKDDGTLVLTIDSEEKWKNKVKPIYDELKKFHQIKVEEMEKLEARYDSGKTMIATPEPDDRVTTKDVDGHFEFQVD